MSMTMMIYNDKTHSLWQCYGKIRSKQKKTGKNVNEMFFSTEWECITYLD